MSVRADVAARLPRALDQGRRFTARARRYRPASTMQNGFRYPTVFAIPSSRPDMIGVFRWGFIPEGIPATDISVLQKKGLTVSVKDVLSRPMFERAWCAGQRCVVLLQAVYEVRSERVVGQQFPVEVLYRITRADGQPMAIGGIWSIWNRKLATVALLTTDANSVFMYANTSWERMPLVLDAEGEQIWLSGAVWCDHEIIRVSKPAPAEWFRFERIEEKVPTPEPVKWDRPWPFDDRR